MAKMQAGRSEESFVLASLKEFVKTWGTGRDGSFQLVCKDGQAKLSMEFSLEAPGSLHFTPSDDNQNSSNREKRRKTPSTLRRDKKRSERHRAQGGPGTAPGAGRGPPAALRGGPAAGSAPEERGGQRLASAADEGPAPAAETAPHAVQDGQLQDYHGQAPPDRSDPTAGSKTAKSKKKKKKIRENGGMDSEPSDSYELDYLRTSPMTWTTSRSIPKALSENVTEAFSNYFNSGLEMVDGARGLQIDPPVLWDEETQLWKLLKRCRAWREDFQELYAIKEEIYAKSNPNSPLRREFWAALSLGMTVFSCQDCLHLGWRRRNGSDGGLGGSAWTVEQIRELRARLWASETDFTGCLGEEVTSLNAVKEKVEVHCMARKHPVLYETVDSESWILSAFWRDKRRQ